MFEQKTDNPELELIVTVININPEYESDNDSRTDKEEPIIGDESKDVFVKNALANEIELIKIRKGEKKDEQETICYKGTG